MHYQTPLDIIAISLNVAQILSVLQMSHEHESHNIQRWSIDQFNERAILCGVCHHELILTNI